MARLARVVMPGVPYHITHRGNRRANVFFDEEDREVYLALLHEYAARYGLGVWAFCLMTNHVHLVAVPSGENTLSGAIGRTHMRYARWLNSKYGWSGHVWANRYYSTALDEGHLWTAVRYVEANPLRAKMVERAENYAWSSCRVHCGLDSDYGRVLDDGRPFPGHVGALSWGGWIDGGVPEEEAEQIRRSTATGRPCGSADFITSMEARLNRILKKQKPGPKGSRETDELTGDLFEKVV